jgi:hypothetical protein
MCMPALSKLACLFLPFWLLRCTLFVLSQNEIRKERLVQKPVSRRFATDEADAQTRHVVTHQEPPLWAFGNGICWSAYSCAFRARFEGSCLYGHCKPEMWDVPDIQPTGIVSFMKHTSKTHLAANSAVALRQ